MNAQKSGPLTQDELRRYSRHLVLPGVGPEGQVKLRGASALVIGAGGLGSPAALYLAAAGVGRIGLVDFDVVDSSNLQRQIIHSSSDVGRAKIASASESLMGLNPLIRVETHEVRLTSKNALKIVSEYDIVLDGSDNFPTRYLVNDACVLSRKPNVSGSIFQYDGQVSVFPVGGPCYRCLYPTPPPPGLVPSCSEAGVLGALPGVIGSLQALEAVKVILGYGETLAGRLLLFDGTSSRFREIKLKRSAECPVCGDNPSIRELIDYDAFCGGGPAPDNSRAHEDMKVEELAERRRRNEEVLLLDVREPFEREICNLGGAFIPMNDVPNRLGELQPDRETVVYCHTGVRSARVAEYLRRNGFRNVRNLAGGIEAWARRIDPTMARY